MIETFDQLARWYRDNQDPLPSRIVSRKRISEDGRPGQYSVEALASAFASAYPVMGEPRIARAHLEHALRRARAAYRFI